MPLTDPSRRDFLQSSIAIAGTALTSGLAPTAATAESPAGPAKRPNLVFFFGEGQRADAMSIAGHPHSQNSES